MANGNGQQDNLSRLDQYVRDFPWIVSGHELFQRELAELLRRQPGINDPLPGEQKQ
jgi:hypothetical protein